MSCAICFDDITKATGRVELSCSHSFHYSCLTNWFGNQMSKDIDESCPCCRHVANEHERLPDMEDLESGSSVSVANLDQHIANERAQTQFEILRHTMAQDALEAYAATRINAVVRGYWLRKTWLRQKSLTEDLDLARRQFRRATAQLLSSSRELKFHTPSLTMTRVQWRNSVAVKIQAVYRGWKGRKMALYKRAELVKVHLAFGVEGWTRSISIGDSASDDGLERQIVFKMNYAAKKIQAAWKAHRVKRVVWRQVGPRAWQRVLV